ncbi:uncharacterized protein PHACADRAFT_192580 [Phanerochaete carnosa HHB-10118-sp]|uniref:Uncharacterized protein n=1 Tax=Phanerochaete carnosa (strain HHB-10118-sp) TaxID=650164 RepID=K5X3Q3_PHACS|nr:uncharacterized protein PHACADRAFT_192580 [Phanerochaete carnosa HHB-10118-sp]EKM57432.1 hypothetical protein PHACADRAFT_192580 [Phanerochaete carnosa HHB-10118-sp]
MAGHPKQRRDFTQKEKQLLTSSLSDPQVQAILSEGWQEKTKKHNKGYKDGTLKDAAVCLQRLVEEQAGVEQGEDKTVEEYQQCIWACAEAENCVWLPAEADKDREAYLDRFQMTGRRIHKWVKNNANRRSVITLPPWPVTRKLHTLRGIGVFSKSDHSSCLWTKSELLEVNSNAAKSWHVSTWNKVVKAAWELLPEAEKAHYDSLAAEEEMKRNEEGIDGATIETKRIRREAIEHIGNHIRDCAKQWNERTGCLSLTFVRGLDKLGQHQLPAEAGGMNAMHGDETPAVGDKMGSQGGNIPMTMEAASTTTNEPAELDLPIPQDLDAGHGSDSPGSISSREGAGEESTVENELDITAMTLESESIATVEEEGLTPSGNIGEMRDDVLTVSDERGLDSSYPAPVSDASNEETGNTDNDEAEIPAGCANKRLASFTAGGRRP